MLKFHDFLSIFVIYLIYINFIIDIFLILIYVRFILFIFRFFILFLIRIFIVIGLIKLIFVYLIYHILCEAILFTMLISLLLRYGFGLLSENIVVNLARLGISFLIISVRIGGIMGWLVYASVITFGYFDFL